jgi:glycosyltransferase involved in cell wall biosynthesis
MGGQRSMALLIEHLDRTAVEPLVICPGPGELTDHLTALGCPVVHIPLHRIKPRTLAAVWRSSRRIRALLRERRIDIIAPDAARDALTCGLAKVGTGTKMVWFVRLTSHDPLDPVLERLADAMIGDSDDTRRRFSSPAAARHRTIVGGADLRRFHPSEDRAAVRRALGLPLDRCILLFVGQVKVAKGVLDIVDALGRLYTSPSSARPLLLLVGTPDPPTLLDELGRRADAAGVAAHLRVLPQQADIAPWMQAADILVSASHQDTEGMSRVLYEAMACGAVPVATDIRGNRDAVTAESGVLVPEHAPADLATALAALMGSPARLATLREGAVRRARECFDIRLHARAVEAWYRLVATGAPLRPPRDKRTFRNRGGDEG